ncbi:MAG: hypothetical protein Fur0036_00190 [Fimbriimonadaceae bacterium]
MEGEEFLTHNRRVSRRWLILFLPLAVAGAGCDPKPEGNLLVPPTVEEAARQEAEERERMAFKPGTFFAKDNLLMGPITLRAEFKANQEAEFVKVIEGTKPLTERMRGTWKEEGLLISITVTEVNGQANKRTETFLIDPKGLIYNELDGTGIKGVIMARSEATVPKSDTATPTKSASGPSGA